MTGRILLGVVVGILGLIGVAVFAPNRLRYAAGFVEDFDSLFDED